MTLRLPESMIDAIRRYGERAYPAECCGVIAGRAGSVKEAVRLFPMPNGRTDDPHRYLIGPEELRAVERELLSTGWEILGYYHSHPDHRAEPSQFDTDHAWPWYSYVIVGVEAGRSSDLTSWTLDAERAIMPSESL